MTIFRRPFFLSLFLLVACHPPELPDKGTTVAPLPPVVSATVDRPTSMIEISGHDGPLNILVDDTPLFQTIAPDPKRSDAETAAEVFRFVSENLFVWNPEGKVSIAGVLYGYGFGMCGMESRILVNLWGQHGIEGRQILWDYHVMAEAFFDNAWHVYDGQHRTDFSALWGKPTSIEDLRAGRAYPEPGLDGIGYSHDVLQEWYTRAEPRLKKGSKWMDEPKLHLKPDHRLRIYPRAGDGALPLPVMMQAQNRTREHLVPGYVLEWSAAVGKKPLELRPGLPVLAVELPEGVEGKITTKKARVSAAETRQLRGSTLPMTFHFPQGTQVTVRYALAGWVGDRLFRAGAGISFPDSNANLVLVEDDQPRVIPRDLSIRPQDDKGMVAMEFTVEWRHMRGDRRDYHFYLDELSSELPFEAWRYVKDWEWFWEADKHGEAGSEKVRISYKPGLGHSPRRPGRYRTLLVHVTGPGVRAGNNFLKATTTLPDNWETVLRKNP
ncbi:MAG: hypothetical protein QNK37_28195 [Acidobacteriota bacterium]|nr:hypothetical protein [Acidobacteriota bacterium]